MKSLVLLEDFALEQRVKNPLPSLGSLTAEEKSEFHNIGYSFLAWLEDMLPQALATREAFPSLAYESRPQILVTTSPSGLLALDELVGECAPSIVCLPTEEYDEWLELGSSLDWMEVIHHWNYFEIHEEQDDLRIHQVGTRWGELCGQGVSHLWRWTGLELELVRKSWATVVY